MKKILLKQVDVIRELGISRTEFLYLVESGQLSPVPGMPVKAYERYSAADVARLKLKYQAAVTND